MKAGVALNPHTNVDLLMPVIEEVDLVCLMSVNPGFGGQKFIEGTYRKVSKLKELISKANVSTKIEIDGGVTKGKDLLEVVQMYWLRKFLCLKPNQQLLSNLKRRLPVNVVFQIEKDRSFYFYLRGPFNDIFSHFPKCSSTVTNILPKSRDIFEVLGRLSTSLSKRF